MKCAKKKEKAVERKKKRLDAENIVREGDYAVNQARANVDYPLEMQSRIATSDAWRDALPFRSVPELRRRWDNAEECYYEKAKQLGLSVAEPYPPRPV